MSTKQPLLSLGSLLALAFLSSPCAAQIIYVRDAAGYVRPVVLPQASVFSMGMQVQAVVGSDRTFARVNVTPFGVSMPDPSTTTFLTIPGPNLGIFDGGFQQPAFISQKPLVLPFQGGQQSLFGPSIFAAQSISMGAPGLSQANPFLFRSNQFSVMSMQSTFPVTSPFLQPGPWPYMNPYQAMWLQASRMNAGPRARIR